MDMWLWKLFNLFEPPFSRWIWTIVVTISWNAYFDQWDNVNPLQWAWPILSLSKWCMTSKSEHPFLELGSNHTYNRSRLIPGDKLYTQGKGISLHILLPCLLLGWEMQHLEILQLSRLWAVSAISTEQLAIQRSPINNLHKDPRERSEFQHKHFKDDFCLLCVC